MCAQESSPTTHYLNVDLDILSRYDLEPLTIALGRKVLVHYCGRHKRTYHAHLSLLPVSPKSAEATIRRFCTLIRTLPRSERKLWDRARVRDFNVVGAGGERSSLHGNSDRRQGSKGRRITQRPNRLLHLCAGGLGGLDRLRHQKRISNPECLVSMATFRALAKILTELIDGAAPEGAFVLNPEDPGLLRTLDKLSFEDASADSCQRSNT